MWRSPVVLLAISQVLRGVAVELLWLLFLGGSAGVDVLRGDAVSRPTVTAGMTSVTTSPTSGTATNTSEAERQVELLSTATGARTERWEDRLLLAAGGMDCCMDPTSGLKHAFKELIGPWRVSGMIACRVWCLSCFVDVVDVM
eukprot:2435757-Prorocentrum_lima.AAC.1